MKQLPIGTPIIWWTWAGFDDRSILPDRKVEVAGTIAGYAVFGLPSEIYENKGTRVIIGCPYGAADEMFVFADTFTVAEMG